MPSPAAASVPDPGVPVSRSPMRSSDEVSGAQALDIRAILRGESVPRGLPGTVADFSTAGANAKPKPQFTTGPLPPLPQQSGPLGAARFDAALLNVTDPHVFRGGSSAAKEVAPAAARPGPGPASYAGTAARVNADRPTVDFDSTSLIEDLIPETGFETHVFSTTELIDGDVPLDLAPGRLDSTFPLDVFGGDTTEPLSDPQYEERPSAESRA